MNRCRGAIALCLLSVCLFGCKKADTAATVTPADAAMASNPNSVAAPPSALPPSDATIPPNTSASTASDASRGPGQSSPSNLNKGQEATSMPLPGQANDHSQVGKEETKK
ncbi:hypothetical protein ACFQAT_11025 [Undibacterium arcticum]|uniref:Lipoprotein n=1 Tax=Undibacterium arcticum TaxID=1762892 RepID=A0ABV7F2D3_9BURK